MRNIDATVVVQADGEGLFGGLSTIADLRWAQQIYREDGCLACLPGEFVVALQRQHCGPAGIVAQRGDDVRTHLVLAGSFPGLLVPRFEELGGHGVLLWVLLTPPLNGFRQSLVVAVLGDDGGLAPLEALDRTVFGDVGVVEPVEFTAQLFTDIAGLAAPL